MSSAQFPPQILHDLLSFSSSLFFTQVSNICRHMCLRIKTEHWKIQAGQLESADAKDVSGQDYASGVLMQAPNPKC